MTGPEQQFNIIPPDEEKSGSKRKAKTTPPPDSLELPVEDAEKLSPVKEGGESVSFLGVEVTKGQGGERVPSSERFSTDVLTDFDFRLMRDIAVTLRLNQPVLIEGGSGIGKSRTIDRMCSQLDRESYYANCHDFDADVLIGKMTTAEDAKSGFGWRDGVVINAIRHGGVLFLDEYNFMKGETRAALHEVIDAILQGKDEITLVDNHGERVPVHPDFRIIAAQNPPGGKHGDREVLDPAQYTRFSHVKLPEDLPKEVKRARALGFLGKDNKITIGDEEYLFSGDLSLEALKEIPGIEELVDKYIEFTETVEAMAEKGELGADQSQPPYFSFQRDYDRVINFVQSFYRGDINDTFQKALRYYYANRFESDSDRAKVEEMIAHIKYVAPANSRRRTLEEASAEESKDEENLEYLAKAFGKGKEKIKPGQLVKGPDGKVSVFVGVSKADGSPVLKPYEGEKTASGLSRPEITSDTEKKEAFLKETFGIWSIDAERISKAELVPISLDPKKLKAEDWEKLKADTDEDKFGEYTLNPEMGSFSDADFEQMSKSGKFKTEKLPDDWNGKPLAEVASYIIKTYGDKYYLPGIEYWQWLASNPDKSPSELKDGKSQFLFGSTLRRSSGHWNVPCVRWRGSGWRRDARWLDDDWRSSYRVVLLEK
ncbi:MAG: AAA family ATPase [Candidatus Paceibacterota bacterium]|jgi:MoxR-like ATPase